jgi:hypothetical protein
MKKYALVNDNIITSISFLEEEEYAEYAKKNQLVVDIDEMFVSPEVGWILEDNHFISTEQDPLKVAIKTVACARDFGIKLKKEMIAKIGGKNLVLSRTEQQVSSIVTQLVSIGFLLEGGALRTARAAVQAVYNSYPEYQEELDYCLSELNNFLGT